MGRPIGVIWMVASFAGECLRECVIHTYTFEFLCARHYLESLGFIPGKGRGPRDDVAMILVPT